MPQRKPLAAEKPRSSEDAHRALDQLTTGRQQASQKPGQPRAATVTTAIHVPRTTLNLLVQVAAARKVKLGGRASVSAVIVSLVEAQRAALEREISGGEPEAAAGGLDHALRLALDAAHREGATSAEILAASKLADQLRAEKERFTGSSIR